MREKQNDTGPLQPFHAASVRLKCMHLCQLHQQSCPLFIFHLEVNQSNALCHMILYHHCRHTSTVPLLHTYMYGIVSASLVPSRKKKTLRTILDTLSNFHTFRQEFEHVNRNATFFNHCNSEDGKCELHMHSFGILASVWLQLRQLRP